MQSRTALIDAAQNLIARHEAATQGTVAVMWQRRVLGYVGIPYRVRPDGSLIVLRVHVEHAYDGSQPARPEPRLRIDNAV
jgi:hypothetical protein